MVLRVRKIFRNAQQVGMSSLLFLVAFFTSWIHEFDFRKGENSEIDSANNDVSLQHFRHLIQEL